MPESDKSVTDAFLTGDAAQDGTAAITVEHDPKGVTVRLVGELDLSTVPDLARVLDRFTGDEPERLLLDLDGVEFMDSTGLAAIVHAQQAADMNGYRLTVRYSSPQVHRLFELAGVLGHFTRE